MGSQVEKKQLMVLLLLPRWPACLSSLSSHFWLTDGSCLFSPLCALTKFVSEIVNLPARFLRVCRRSGRYEDYSILELELLLWGSEVSRFQASSSLHPSYFSIFLDFLTSLASSL